MARYARIADGRVAEIIDYPGFDPATCLPPSIGEKVVTLTDADAAVVEGYTYDGSTFTAPVEQPDVPAPVPQIISDRQFGEGLWHDGLITYAECEAFVSIGTIPAALQAIIDTLADDDTGQPTPRKLATILVKGAKEYERANPLVDTVREAQKWTPEQLDDHWRAWAAL